MCRHRLAVLKHLQHKAVLGPFRRYPCARLPASNTFVLGPIVKNVETPFKTGRNDVTLHLNRGP